jgi:hypothetical protein
LKEYKALVVLMLQPALSYKASERYVINMEPFTSPIAFNVVMEDLVISLVTIMQE